MSELFKLHGKISVTNEEANSAIDETIGKAKELKGALEETSSGATSASQSVKEVGKSAESTTASMEKASSTSVFLGEMWANIVTKAGAYVKDFAKDGVAYNMQIEKNIGALTAYFDGSREKAEEYVDQLRELDKETPYDLGGLLNASTNLAQYGVPVDEMLETLELLGNVAAGDANKLYGLARVYGQTVSTGKLTGQDVLQYATNGFAVTESLKKLYGYSGEALADMQKNGQITPDMVKQALIAETSPGGRYYGMLESIMNTPYGKQERFGSDFEMAQGAITEPLTENMGNLYPVLSDIVNFLGENASETRLGLNVLGSAGGYTLLSRFIPKLKGVGLKDFIKGHPLLAAAFGLGEIVNYADEKTAAMDAKSGFISGPEKILGTGEGKYSGMIGELLEMPQDIAQYASLDSDTKQKLTRELFDYLLTGDTRLGGTTRLKTDSGEIFGGSGASFEEAEAVMNTTAGFGLKLWQDTFDSSKKAGILYDTPIGPQVPEGWIPAGNAVESSAVSGIASQVTAMVSLLSQIAANNGQPIYLDSGLLVGGIGPALNDYLGNIVSGGD